MAISLEIAVAVDRLKTLLKEKGPGHLETQRCSVEAQTCFLQLLGTPALSVVDVLRKQLDVSIWKLCFHSHIEFFRKKIRAASASSSSSASPSSASSSSGSSSSSSSSISTTDPSLREISGAFSTFLQRTADFYTAVLGKLRGLYRIEADRVPVVSGNEELRAACLLCHRAFLSLGDISRYHRDLRPKTQLNWAAAAAVYYQKSFWLCPEEGDALNQMAVLASYRGDVIGAIYYYVRAINVPKRYEVAQTNLNNIISNPRSISLKITPLAQSVAQLHAWLWSPLVSASLLDFRPWMINVLRELEPLLSRDPIGLKESQLAQLAICAIADCHKNTGVGLECAGQWLINFSTELLKSSCHRSTAAALNHLPALAALGLVADYLRIRPSLLSHLAASEGKSHPFCEHLSALLNEVSISLGNTRGNESLIRRAAPYDRDDSAFFLPEELQVRGFTPLWPSAYTHLNLSQAVPLMDEATLTPVQKEANLEVRINKLRAFGIWLAAQPHSGLFHSPDTLRFAPSRAAIEFCLPGMSSHTVSSIASPSSLNPAITAAPSSSSDLLRQFSAHSIGDEHLPHEDENDEDDGEEILFVPPTTLRPPLTAGDLTCASAASPLLLHHPSLMSSPLPGSPLLHHMAPSASPLSLPMSFGFDPLSPLGPSSFVSPIARPTPPSPHLSAPPGFSQPTDEDAEDLAHESWIQDNLAHWMEPFSS